jgi:uncharacterized protein
VQQRGTQQGLGVAVFVCIIAGVMSVEPMKFEWSDRKNEANIGKHGFDFTDAYRIFDLPMAVELDERDDYGEDRWVGLGMLDGRVVVVVYTEPDPGTIRIISLRKALSYERRNYEQYIEDGLG